ncbi:hypothetical protein [Verrucomicrobium spinosum]|uniref:hypothetical protein n=1 Tax=Verrucomicrobium spinosum TaxID=2736 RepID=UPI0001746BB3|nr:hypothetical protein [Verrucomicrobium spinosum]
MKPLLIASFLFALVLAAPAAAPLSPEARADFAWFETLGFPATKNAESAEIRRADDEGEINTPSRLTFVLQQKEETSLFWTPICVLWANEEEKQPLRPALTS